MGGNRSPDEFKIEAVNQVVNGVYSVAEVASRLGATKQNLYAWKKKSGPKFAQFNERWLERHSHHRPHESLGKMPRKFTARE